MPTPAVLQDHGSRGEARVSVVVPLYNYAHLVLEALDSVAAQTLDCIELVIIDDASTDDSLRVASDWLEQRHGRFTRAVLLRHQDNGGLAASRNAGVLAASAPAFFPLDADNILYPRCLALLESALSRSDAAFAYPMLEVFEAGRSVMGTPLWSAARLARSNYIDAMALVRTADWQAAGGYTPMHGWEDYDLWCRFHERGRFGIQVPNILARYRLHYSSMLRTITNRPERQVEVLAEMRRRHPWLSVS